MPSFARSTYVLLRCPTRSLHDNGLASLFDSWPVEKPRWCACFAALLTLAITLCDSSRLHAQQTGAPQPAQQAGEEFVELNLTGSVSLPSLVEAVSRQLNVRFLYSADLANRQVTVYTPARLPKSALPILLGSLLKGENLVVVDSDVPGWKRIVDIAALHSVREAAGDAQGKSGSHCGQRRRGCDIEVTEQ